MLKSTENDIIFETSNSNSEVSKSNSKKITSFLKTMFTSEGAISHSVLYYQQLPITRYQMKLYANLFWVIANSVHSL